MAKAKANTLSRNYEDVEGRETYDGDPPKPAIYEAKLVGLSDHPTDNSPDGVEWKFEVTEKPYESWQGYVYTNGDSSAWKEVQILTAVGLLADPKGKISLTHDAIVSKAGPCRLRIANEDYEGETRGKIRKILPPEEGGGGKKKGKKGKKKDQDPF